MCLWGILRELFRFFFVHHKGIDLDPTKARATTLLSPSMTLKELRSFVGKVSYLRRFIPDLVEILKPLVEKTKKGVGFIWCD